MADYAVLSPDLFADVACVVICVGIAEGKPEALQRLNVETPCSIARAAKAAGVPRLIHISSFSVYGLASEIGRDTPVSPRGNYGCSKLDGDRRLLSLADAGFEVTILRLPLIYSPGSLGKLGQLLKAWRSVRLLPVPRDDVTRAMIAVDLAAETIERLTQMPAPGAPKSVVFAADPMPFSYAGVASARPERLYRFPLPRTLTRLMMQLAPALGARLFADSRLADADNLAVEFGLATRLRQDVAEARP